MRKGWLFGALLLVVIFSVIAQVAQAGTSTGTGFIVSADGYVLTNEHVIHGANSITVLIESKAYEATVIESSEQNDLALLKVAPPGVEAVMLGNSLLVEIFTEVVAFGYPMAQYGRDLTVSQGMITSVRTNVGGREGRDTLQHDAVIFHGSSGGPLFNMKGEVIGINYAGVSGSGLEFAIPIAEAIPLLRRIPGFSTKTLGQAVAEITPQEIHARYAASVVLIEADVTISLRSLIPETIPGYEGRIVDVVLDVDAAGLEDDTLPSITRQGFDVVQAVAWIDANDMFDDDNARWRGKGAPYLHLLVVQFATPDEAIRAWEAGGLVLHWIEASAVISWYSRSVSYWENVGTLSVGGASAPCRAVMSIANSMTRWTTLPFPWENQSEMAPYGDPLRKRLIYSFTRREVYPALNQVTDDQTSWASINAESCILIGSTIFWLQSGISWSALHMPYEILSNGVLMGWNGSEIVPLTSAQGYLSEFESIAKYVFGHVLSQL
jgi:hypothetical protein